MTENSQKPDATVNQSTQNSAEMRDGAGDVTAPIPHTPDWGAIIAEHIATMPPPCEHEFGGWREFEGEHGRGGEQFCQKCGAGMMAWSMRFLP